MTIDELRASLRSIRDELASAAGCGRDAGGEIVLMPNPCELDALAAMYAVHVKDENGDYSTWPSVELCAECAERLAPLFATVGALPIAELLLVTPDRLALACKFWRYGAEIDELEQLWRHS